MQPERAIEEQILLYLQTKGILAFKIKTTGTFDPQTRGFRRTGKWYRKGIADILGIYKGKFLAIEVKTETGRVNPNQKLFLQDVLNNGGIAMVARSVEEVEKELKKQEEQCQKIENT